MKNIAYKIGFEGSLKKIFREPELNKQLESCWNKTSIALSACRNEYENFQILLYSQDGALENVSIEISDLVNGNNNSRIDHRNISKYQVGYLKTEKPPYPVEHVGFWPDPLFPFDALCIKQGLIQPIWITVYVPKESPAGHYYGSIRIKPANGVEKKVALNIKIRDFEIPEKSHLLLPFDFNTRDDMSAFDKFYPLEGDDRTEMLKKYLDYLADHKINSLIYGYLTCRDEKLLSIRRNAKGAYEYDFAKLENLLEYIVQKGFSFNIFIPDYCKNTKCTFIINPLLKDYAHLGDKIFTSPEFEKTIVELLQSYVAFLKKKGWLDRAYCSTWDEAPPKYYEHAKHINKMVKEAAPTLETSMSSNTYPDDLIANADILVTHLALYDENIAGKLRGKGKKIWCYVSNAPCDHPALYIDYPAVDPRILFWMSWKYQLDGFVYWNVNAWHYQLLGVQNYSADKAGIGLTPDTPWNVHHKARYAVNGCGTLVYPGKDGPIGSIRMELIRDGVEDYEYLWLLNHEIEELKKMVGDKNDAGQKLLEESEAVLEIVNKLITSNKIYENNPEKLIGARERIGDQIEKIINSIDSKEVSACPMK